jgi:hypothetical protein
VPMMCLQPSSASQNEGLKEGFDWLVERII